MCFCVSASHFNIYSDVPLKMCAEIYTLQKQWELQSVVLNQHEIKWNANLMQLGNFIDVFLARHVSGTYAHRQEH